MPGCVLGALKVPKPKGSRDMSEDSPRPIGVDLGLQCLFDSAFRGHRIHALPPKGRTRVWDAPPETTPWIEAARAWMERQKGCKFYFSPGTINTTLADLFTLLLLADLSSAVRA